MSAGDLCVRVSIDISIPKRFQTNCSIDLCYVKIAVSETLPLYSYLWKLCDIISEGGANYSHQKLLQQATKLETVEAKCFLKCPMKIPLLSVSKGILLAMSGPKKLYAPGHGHLLGLAYNHKTWAYSMSTALATVAFLLLLDISLLHKQALRTTHSNWHYRTVFFFVFF